jgi:hypothetical protein
VHALAAVKAVATAAHWTNARRDDSEVPLSEMHLLDIGGAPLGKDCGTLCSAAEGDVTVRPAAARPVAQSQKVMDRGLPGPGLLSSIVISKGQDSQPLYRQSDILGRSYVHIVPDDSASMDQWSDRTSFALARSAMVRTRQMAW